MLEAYRPYVAEQLAGGVYLSHLLRPTLGLFAGHSGARHFKRTISERAHQPGAGLEVLDEAVRGIPDAVLEHPRIAPTPARTSAASPHSPADGPTMNLLRPVLGMLGLAIGFGLYAAAGRYGEPIASLLIGLMFVVLGALAVWYAQGERWIQVLGAVLAVYGLLRMTVLH